MQGVNVFDDPPPPETPFEALAGDRFAGWESGAAVPPTLKGLIGALAFACPRELAAEAGRLLTAVGDLADDSAERRMELFRPLLEGNVPGSDLVPPRMLAINPRAPQTAVVEAVKTFLRGWKRELGVPETRLHADLLPEALRVWDLREGWTGAGYDASRERTLLEVGQATQLDLSTVRNRYQAAFGRLVGHDYSPEAWVRVFGPLKLGPLLPGAGLPRRSLRRPWKTRGERAAPESAVAATGGYDREGFLAGARITLPEMQAVEIALDVDTLLGLGRTTGEILVELELGPEAAEFVVRQRARRAEAGEARR